MVDSDTIETKISDKKEEFEEKVEDVEEEEFDEETKDTFEDKAKILLTMLLLIYQKP